MTGARSRRWPWGPAAGVAGLALALVAGPAGATHDERFAEQWNLAQIGAPAAWATSTGQGVTVGIVDTGVDVDHPDLAGKVDALATCLGGPCREGAAPDRIGHGTAMAGVVAAAHDGVGIVGVAPDARLVVAKAIADDGMGTTADINNAIRWVVDRGADVVNLSLGGADRRFVTLAGTPLASGIEYAWSRGAIPVLAAGNYDDVLADDVPADEGLLGESASYNYGDLDAVVVGATDRGGEVAGYSVALGDAKWGVVAPGGGDEPAEGVLVPLPGRRHAVVSGTSVAAPHVAGILALLRAQDLPPAEAVDRLLATAEAGSCGRGCRGRVRADAAVASSVAVTEARSQEAEVRAGQSGGDGRVDPALAALAAVLAALAAAGTATVARR